MLTDRDECAESPNRCGGGTCVNIKADKTTINGFKCDCGPGHVTFKDIACAGEPLEHMMTYKKYKCSGSEHLNSE